MNEEQNAVQLNLYRLAMGVYRRLLWLLLAAVLGAGSCLLAGRFLLTPQYQSSVVLYVNNAQEKNVYSGDLTTSRNLVDSILVILNTRETMLDIIAYAQVNYSLPEMETMISATAVNNTEFFRITVTSPDMYEAERIANAIGSVLPEHIAQVLEGSSAKVVDPAVIASKPSTPGLGRCALLGGLLGLGFALAGICLWEFFDDTLRDPRELTDFPVLAVVPGEEGWRLLRAKLDALLPRQQTIGLAGPVTEIFLENRNHLHFHTPAEALEQAGQVDAFVILAWENCSRIGNLKSLARELGWSGKPVLGILYVRKA